MFAARKIRWKDQDWPTGEHIFQAENFVDEAGSIRELIRNARSPRQAKRLAKRLARRFPDCVRADWKTGKRDEVMAAIIDEIVYQDPDVRRTLTSTGTRLLVENAPHPYWGWGEDGNGKNRLGKLWMAKRAKLEIEGLCG